MRKGLKSETYQGKSLDAYISQSSGWTLCMIDGRKISNYSINKATPEEAIEIAKEMIDSNEIKWED